MTPERKNSEHTHTHKHKHKHIPYTHTHTQAIVHPGIESGAAAAAGGAAGSSAAAGSTSAAAAAANTLPGALMVPREPPDAAVCPDTSPLRITKAVLAAVYTVLQVGGRGRGLEEGWGCRYQGPN